MSQEQNSPENQMPAWRRAVAVGLLGAISLTGSPGDVISSGSDSPPLESHTIELNLPAKGPVDTGFDIRKGPNQQITVNLAPQEDPLKGGTAEVQPFTAGNFVVAHEPFRDQGGWPSAEHENRFVDIFVAIDEVLNEQATIVSQSLIARHQGQPQLANALAIEAGDLADKAYMVAVEDGGESFQEANQIFVDKILQENREKFGSVFLSAMETTSGIKMNFYTDNELEAKNITINHEAMNQMFQLTLKTVREYKGGDNDYARLAEMVADAPKDVTRDMLFDVVLPSVPGLCISYIDAMQYVPEEAYIAHIKGQNGEETVVHQGSRNENCNAIGIASGLRNVGFYDRQNKPSLRVVEYPKDLIVIGSPVVFNTGDNEFGLGETEFPADFDFDEKKIATWIENILIHEWLHGLIDFAGQRYNQHPEIVKGATDGAIYDLEHELFVTPMAEYIQQQWTELQMNGEVASAIRLDFSGLDNSKLSEQRPIVLK